MGRPGIAVEVSASESEQLVAMSRSRSLPHSLVRRAKIVLMAADGHSNSEIAALCAVTPPAVTHWKKRFVAQGLAGLHDQAKSGRPRTHDDEAVAELLSKVLRERLRVRRIGACVQRQRKPAYPRAPLLATSPCSVCSPIVRKASSCPMTRSSSRKSATSSGCT